MILIIGGAYQGKRRFAEETFGENADILPDLHLWVLEKIRQGADPMEEAEKLMTAHPAGIFLMDELGCGIVPAEAEDRQWRELSGRIGCRLAAGAEAVYRVQCGIAARIK